MNISDDGIALVKEFEGCRLRAYQDSVFIWTIGYGHTRGVKDGDTCTQDEADAWLREDLRDAEKCVERCVTAALTQHEFDALVSFAFNLGCRRLEGSTLLRKLNGGDYDGASKEFLRWSRAGGQVVAGLVRRREAEARLFETA